MTAAFLISVICKDKPGATPRRQEFLDEHLAHIEKTVDGIFLAGPIFAEDNKTICGSLLIYKTDSIDTAKALIAADPYYKADIWETITYNRFLGAAGEAVGGIAYK